MSRAATRSTRSTICIGTVLVGLAPVACGEGTGPIETGSVDAVLLDNPASELALTDSFVWLAHHKSFGGDYYHGFLAASVELQLSPDGVDYLSAGRASALRIALQDEAIASEPLAGDLPAGTYPHVRLVLREAVASLQAGSEIGGSEIDGTAALPVAPGLSVTVDLRLDQAVVIAADRRSTLVFDLNTERWVTEDHLIAGQVPGAEVAAAVSVGVSAPVLPSTSGV